MTLLAVLPLPRRLNPPKKKRLRKRLEHDRGADEPVRHTASFASAISQGNGWVDRRHRSFTPWVAAGTGGGDIVDALQVGDLFQRVRGDACASALSIGRH